VRDIAGEFVDKRSMAVIEGDAVLHPWPIR
jgi:hypothetical protein